MSVIALLEAATGGAAITLGLLHLWFAVRARRTQLWEVNAWFALLCGLTFWMTVPTIQLLMAADTISWARASKQAATPNFLMVAATVWFVACYADVRPRWFLWGMTVICVGTAVINVALPLGITTRELGAFAEHTLPWGERVAMPEVEVTPWVLLLGPPTLLAKWLFGMLAGAKLARAGARRKAWVVGGLVSVQTATIVNDMLVSNRVIGGLYLVDFGCLVLLVGVSFDLVDRAVHAGRVESELAASEARLATLVANTPSAVFFKDPAGRYRLVNRYFGELVGQETSAIVGQTDAELFPEGEGNRFREGDVEVMSTGKVLTLEQHLPTRKGERWFLTVKFALTDERGVPSGVCGIATDVTPLKRANAELQRTHAVLERRVADRTDDLESFTAAVSHDLRAPLRHLQGFLAIAMETHGASMDPGLRELLDRAHACALHMGHLVEDLSTLSRLGLRDLRVGRVDSRALVDDVWRELRESGAATRHELVVGDLPPVDGDAGLLRIVWMNLIGNAVKYTGKSEHPRVAVCGGRDEEGSWFRIEDNGVGFDPRYAGKLYEPFQRLHLREEFPGTGVGLATVKRIVVRHGGSVSATGVPDQGATFSFRLPAEPGPAEPG